MWVSTLWLSALQICLAFVLPIFLKTNDRKTNLTAIYLVTLNFKQQFYQIYLAYANTNIHTHIYTQLYKSTFKEKVEKEGISIAFNIIA